MRADARANRQRILDVADGLFTEHGLTVPLDDIARHAGLGPGTLHRHFPTKDVLIAAVALAHLEALAAAAEDRAHGIDPAAALRDQLTAMIAAGDRHAPLKRALAGGPADVAWSETDVSRRLRDALHELLVRAQRAGAARPDLRGEDLIALLAGAYATIQRAGVAAHSRQGRRLTSITLTGIGLDEVTEDGAEASTPLADRYIAAEVGRWRSSAAPSDRVLDLPGLSGLVGAGGDGVVDARLIVRDDRAHGELTARHVAEGRSGVVTVFAAARRCAELFSADPGWASSTLTAMYCGDVSAAPVLALPEGLELRPVRRVNGDPADGVELDAVLRAVAAAAPDEDPVTLGAFLRSMPDLTRLFAAVDGDGAVCATAGWHLHDACARVILVDTVPAWRRRGTATAMTSLALRAARAHGAREATLDASRAARSLYLRVGFAQVSEMTRFRPAG